MGFFDKILQGLGFEGENESTDILQINNKNEKQQQVICDNLEPTPKVVKKRKTIKVTPKTQLEVENILEDLKFNNNIMINLENFNDADILRAMDFIAGYCKCLGASIQKVDDNIFLLEIICD